MRLELPREMLVFADEVMVTGSVPQLPSEEHMEMIAEPILLPKRVMLLFTRFT